MQIKMIARGVETTFSINAAADFAAVEAQIKMIVESYTWGYNWLGLRVSVEIESKKSTARLYDNCGIYDSIEMIASGSGGQKMKCSEWHRGTAGTVDFTVNAERMLKNFLADCLFEAVNELNRRGEFNNIALRGAIADFLNSSDYGRELIESIVDPAKN